MKYFEKICAVACCCVFFFCEPNAQAAINDGQSIKVLSINLKTDTTGLKGTTWQLSEMDGKPVDTTNKTVPVIIIILYSAGNEVSGNAGCNNFNGSYELKGNDEIKFTALNSTKKTCPDQENENTFLHELGSVDTYTVNGGQLTLSKRGKPLLRFRTRRPHT